MKIEAIDEAITVRFRYLQSHPAAEKPFTAELTPEMEAAAAGPFEEIRIEPGTSIELDMNTEFISAKFPDGTDAPLAADPV